MGPTTPPEPEHADRDRQPLDLTKYVGRPVKLPEVVPHADPKCRSCLGAGVHVTVAGGSRTHKVCLCALKRFLKAFAGKVVPVHAAGGRTDYFWAPSVEASTA